jgi:hypothetical protein
MLVQTVAPVASGRTCRVGACGCEVGMRRQAAACTAEAAAALVWHPVLLLLLQRLLLVRLPLQRISVQLSI